jgi:thioredoxin-like negative regulator of GroEL
MATLTGLTTALLCALASAATADGIKEIPDSALAQAIAESRGVLLVHVTSRDSNCGPCIQSNPRMDTFARTYAAKATFVRVVQQPWTHFGPAVTQLKLLAVPAVLVFRDGKETRRVLGDLSAKNEGLLREQIGQ